jgi:hypothetical protein
VQEVDLLQAEQKRPKEENEELFSTEVDLAGADAAASNRMPLRKPRCAPFTFSFYLLVSSALHYSLFISHFAFSLHHLHCLSISLSPFTCSCRSFGVGGGLFGRFLGRLLSDSCGEGV